MQAREILVAIGVALLSISATSDQSTSLTSTTKDCISITVKGAGPDVILIPGLASSRDIWATLVTRLQRNYRLHLVQLAGFAGSPAILNPDGQVVAPTAEAVAEYIRRGHLRMPVVIGHSLGGEVALMLGARHPDRVGRLLIVDALPFYSLLIDPAATSETVKPRAAAFRDAMLAMPAAQAETIQTAAIARLAKTKAVRPALVLAEMRSDKKTVADATYELMITDLRPELGRIKAPMEVVYAYDPIYGVPASDVDALFHNAYTSAPHAIFKRIDDSFHFIMLDQPEVFERAVINFLR